jgi:hypothetical protein
MAHTNALEGEIAALKAKPQSPETKAAIEANVKQLSKVKLMKPFEYSHQGPSSPTLSIYCHFPCIASVF